jgi:RNA polymerase sigma-70 factor (ECF subfamily)
MSQTVRSRAGQVESPEDAAVLERIGRGDQEMLAILYDRYSAATLALLVRIVGSRARAEDLLQDVFLQVWRRAGDYANQRGSVAAWLFTIARNRALDVVRSADHKRVDLLAETPAVPDEAAPHPEMEAAESQRGRAVRAAIASLTPLQRQAVELAYYDGLSHSEIAERLKEPLGTIKSRIGQAMIRLRAALKEHEGEGA